jgi:hypothetical protein
MASCSRRLIFSQLGHTPVQAIGQLAPTIGPAPGGLTSTENGMQCRVLPSEHSNNNILLQNARALRPTATHTTCPVQVVFPSTNLFNMVFWSTNLFDMVFRSTSLFDTTIWPTSLFEVVIRPAMHIFPRTMMPGEGRRNTPCNPRT